MLGLFWCFLWFAGMETWTWRQKKQNKKQTKAAVSPRNFTFTLWHRREIWSNSNKQQLICDFLLCVCVSDSGAGEENDSRRSWQHTGWVWGPDVPSGPEELFITRGHSHLYQICRVRGGSLQHHRPYGPAEIRCQSHNQWGKHWFHHSSLNELHCNLTTFK